MLNTTDKILVYLKDIEKQFNSKLFPEYEKTIIDGKLQYRSFVLIEKEIDDNKTEIWAVNVINQMDDINSSPRIHWSQCIQCIKYYKISSPTKHLNIKYLTIKTDSRMRILGRYLNWI